MTLQLIKGGVCVARGFQAAGVIAGIKQSGRPDLALVLSESRAAAAGVFTQNAAPAAPVILSREHLSDGSARAVVVNAGCANACTGDGGYQDAIEMGRVVARSTGISDKEVLVCSTGLIGSRLPMEAVSQGIEKAAASLGPNDEQAAEAIMTTDTFPKLAAVRNAKGWSLGGMAKGAAMIAPNMATMLAVITTDARVDPKVVSSALGIAVDSTFNAITIEGDTSTNDSVICLANGASGVDADEEELTAALTAVCRCLSEKIVLDGEGSTKLVRVRVRGAADRAEAVAAARRVAESVLVKTALFGGDPNWGRIVAALGNAGVRLELGKLTVSLQGIALFSEGAPTGEGAKAAARAALESRDVIITCDLQLGDGAAEFLTTDLSQEYVRLNSEYET